MSPIRGPGRFRPTDRIRSSRDFRRVSRLGRRCADGTVVILLAETESDTGDLSSPAVRNRLGLTVSRKVGGAVVRNQVKRRVREWFRQNRDQFPEGDIVVIARPSAGRVPASILQRDLRIAAAKLRKAA